MSSKILFTIIHIVFFYFLFFCKILIIIKKLRLFSKYTIKMIDLRIQYDQYSKSINKILIQVKQKYSRDN